MVLSNKVTLYHLYKEKFDTKSRIKYSVITKIMNLFAVHEMTKYKYVCSRRQKLRNVVFTIDL